MIASKNICLATEHLIWKISSSKAVRIIQVRNISLLASFDMMSWTCSPRIHRRHCNSMPSVTKTEFEKPLDRTNGKTNSDPLCNKAAVEMV